MIPSDKNQELLSRSLHILHIAEFSAGQNRAIVCGMQVKR